MPVTWHQVTGSPRSTQQLLDAQGSPIQCGNQYEILGVELIRRYYFVHS